MVPGRARRDPAWVGWAAVAAVSLFPVEEMLQILVFRPKVVLYGDQALIDLGAQRAAHLGQLLGPYSRTGFHHPGPAVFYLLAPFSQLLGPSGGGIYLGALALNLACLVAAVAVVWRAGGGPAALWAAAAIDAYSLCLGVSTWREPWNPYLVVAPMLLFLVLWAAASSGAGRYGVWALVVGSYEIQTEIATGPVVVALCALLGWRAIRLIRSGKPAARRWPPGAGLIALAAIWTAPVIELFRDHPNDVVQIWHYLGSSTRTGPGWGQTSKIVGDALSVLPFGNRDYRLVLRHSTVEVVLELLLIAAVSAAAIRFAGRARPFPAHLAGGAVAAGLVGAVSLQGSAGAVDLYFALWLSVIALAVLVALGAALQLAGSWPRNLLAVAAGSAAVCTLGAGLSMPSIDHTSGSGPWPPADAISASGRARTVAVTAAFDTAAARAVGRGDRSVLLTIGSPSLWPYAAGIVWSLDRRGVSTSVAPTVWTFYFGPNPPASPAGQVRLSLVPAQPPGVADQGIVVAELDGAALISAVDGRSMGAEGNPAAPPGRMNRATERGGTRCGDSECSWLRSRSRPQLVAAGPN